MIYPDWLGTYSTSGGVGGYLADKTLTFDTTPAGAVFDMATIEFSMTTTPAVTDLDTQIITTIFEINLAELSFDSAPTTFDFTTTPVVTGA